MRISFLKKFKCKIAILNLSRTHQDKYLELNYLKKGSKLVFYRPKSKNMPEAITGNEYNFETIRLQKCKHLQTYFSKLYFISWQSHFMWDRDEAWFCDSVS